MKEIVGIKFKKPGKIYFFDPGHLKLKLRDKVIVDTANGEELAEISIANKLVEDDKVVEPLRKIIRYAIKKDFARLRENKEKEKEAFNICLEKIAKHKLPMKLINVEYKFDRSKLLFYFTADGRIDFRELVKDLAAIFKTRIELRQIGVRDEVKRIGGNGVCGRELCCCTFLNNFEAVSIKMAKEQNMSLNPSKISGVWGRLMCCLKYEQNVYEELLKITPKVGALVALEDGTHAKVCEINPLTGDLKVMPEKSDVPIKVNRDTITILRDGKIKVNQAERKALQSLEDQ